MDPVDPDSDPEHCPNVCYRSMMYGCQYYPDLIECSFKHFLAWTERDLADYKLLFLNKHWVFVIPQNCQIEDISGRFSG